MQTAQQVLRQQHRLLGLAGGQLGAYRKAPSRQCRKTFIWSSQDFNGLVSKVQVCLSSDIRDTHLWP